MVFKEFFKPKWQHRNPAVRQQAIELLDPERDKWTLLEIVHQDTEPRLRCLAVRKLADLKALLEIKRAATNWEVSQLAGQRYQQLLAGVKEPVPPLETRLSLVNESEDQALLEYLAQKAREVEVRLAALEKIQREGLLGDIALTDENPQARLAALERVTQESTLERIAKNSRNRDKRVYRRASERLEAMIEERERPLRLRAQREALCQRLELLLKAEDWERSKPEMERLAQQWTEIEGEPEAELVSRFEDLQARFIQGWQEEQTRQAAIATLKVEKQALCESIEGLLMEVDGADVLEPEQARKLEHELSILETRWEQIPSIGGLVEERFQSCFRDASRDIRGDIRELEETHRLGLELEKLLKDSERQLEKTAPVSRKAVEQLREGLEKIQLPEKPGARLKELDCQLRANLDALEQKREQQREAQKKNEKNLRTTLRELEVDLEQGELRKSRNLEQQARDLLKELGHLPRNQKAPLENRLHAASAKIRELRSWQHWGNTLEREKLCETVEALIGLEGDPEDIARRIREAQDEWKQLSVGDESGHALWQRFQTACQSAYQPCQEHFQARARERRDNLGKKEAICQQLESFAEQTDWSVAREPEEWKKLYHRVQDWRREFNHVGPVDRKQQKAINKRFEQVWENLESYFERERKRNLRQRQQLIEKVQALAGHPDLRQAINEVKELQKTWHISVPASRREERELWKTFRKACDAIFNRRKEEQKAEDSVRQQHLEAKHQVCAQIETLAELPDEEAEQIPARLHKLQGEWDQAGPVPKKALSGLERRYDKALRAAEQRHADWRTARRRARMEVLREKSRLCSRLEQAEGAAAAEEIEQAWRELPALEDADLERQMETRLTRARQALEAGEIPPAFSEQTLQELDLLCIRLELLAGIDSPPEATQRRMAYQVEKLSRAMGGDKPAAIADPDAEIREVETAWYLLGPLGIQHPLEQRFEYARQAATSSRAKTDKQEEADTSPARES